MNTKRILIFSVAIGLGLASFQNCSLVNSSHTDMNSLGKTCLATAQKAFLDTYYPHLRSQCAKCHDNNGAGISWFASSNSQTAFTSFMNTSRAKVNMQMVNDGHPGPNNGPNQQAWVTSQSAQWTKIDKEIEDCQNANAIVTLPKNTPVQEVAIANADIDRNRRPWRILEYDLFSEVMNESQKNQIQMTVRIRYREFGAGVIKAGVANAGQPCGANVAPANCEYLADDGYEFSNPTARLRTGAPEGTKYAIDKMSVLRNGARLTTVTSFEAIDDVAVTSTTEMPLINPVSSPAIVPTKDLATDVFQLRFAEIRDAGGTPIGSTPNPSGPTLPARVTYADLSNSGNPYGYFARNCFGCHAPGNPSGGLDMTSYSAAQLSASSIRSRVNDPNRPMPPGGLLPQFDRQVIGVWVSGGAPQN